MNAYRILAGKFLFEAITMKAEETGGLIKIYLVNINCEAVKLNHVCVMAVFVVNRVEPSVLLP
jgi:hypothetical protein